MKMPSLDGTRGFAHNLWTNLTDGGVWAIPRTGLVYVKEEQEWRFALIGRMAWEEGMPLTPEELREEQDIEHQKIAQMFDVIGIEVVDACA